MSKSPDAFRTISEVAEWLDTPAHVLRFWESKFAQVKPVKRAGGRRYYRPSDMRLLGGIKKLLHDDGMTIKGVQKILSEQGVKAVAALAPPLETEEAPEIEHEALEAAPPERPPHPVDETIEDAPFIEAEAPASTVVPFTGGALAETPDAESERDVPAQPPLPDQEIAETASEVADPAMGTDAIRASDAEAEAVEALVHETLADAAPETPADLKEEDGQGSLFGQTPDFLAKTLEERSASSAEVDVASASEAADSETSEPAVTANQPHGPLKHLGGLTRLTASEAAAIAPLVKVLRERGRASA